MSATPARRREQGGREPLLVLEHLTQRFPVAGDILEAVSDVSISVSHGETLGLVGESGSGKSSLGRAIIQLPPPSAGSVQLGGRRLESLSRSELRITRTSMQMIFQDATAALNPRRRVRDIVAEGPVVLGWSRERTERRVREMMELVGLDPDYFGARRRHELSGGQCQRVVIARALVVEPRLLICDEPVASLDVSVQGQILNLLEELRARYEITMLFITHDLSVVHAVSDRIGVMYLGKLVEYGDVDVLSTAPAHPYTKGLLDSLPVPDPHLQVPATDLQGEIPSPLRPPSGCRFRTRCTQAQARCAAETPVLRPVSANQMVACHFPLQSEVILSPRGREARA